MIEEMDLPEPGFVGAAYCIVCKPEIWSPGHGLKPNSTYEMRHPGRPGLVHRSSCPTLPMNALGEEAQERLDAELAKIKEAERRAWRHMNDVIF